MKIILGILIAIVVICIGGYAYYGGFQSIAFTFKEQGGEVLVYEEVIGDYKQSAEYTNKIYYKLLEEDGIETTKGFGLYLDNPKEVETSELRSEIGCIIDNPDSTLIAKLSEKYKVKVFPKGNYAFTEFPMKGKLSFLIGIMKVYPALEKFCEEHDIHGGAVMEIYDVPNQKIIYRDTKEVPK